MNERIDRCRHCCIRGRLGWAGRGPLGLQDGHAGQQELEEARLARVAEAARTGEIPTLRRDPVTGAYRPG